MSGFSVQQIGAGLHQNSLSLRSIANDFKSELSKLNLPERSIVAIEATPFPAFFSALSAAWHSGFSVLLLPVTLTQVERERLIAFAGAQYLFDAAYLVASSSEDREQVGPRIDFDFADDLFSPSFGGAALHLITSGTTGDPKVVTISHDALRARVVANANQFPTGTFKKTLCVLALSFGHGLIGNALTTAYVGGSLLLSPSPTAAAAKLSEIVESHRITFMSAVPTFWRMVIAYDLGLRAARTTNFITAGVGSAYLSQTLANEIRSLPFVGDVFNFYGITEMCNWVSAAKVTEAYTVGMVGRPMIGDVAVKLSDGTVQALGQGEILLRSPSQFSGYLFDHERTEESFCSGWFRTGDAGHVEPDSIRITGRLRDEIVRGGFKISPDELDALICSHPDVLDACSFGVPGGLSDMRICVLVVPRKPSKLTPGSMHSWCASRLRSDSMPDEWRFVDTIPVTDRGKVSRSLLAQAWSEE